MAELEHDDALWAWRLGLTYGGWYPNLLADLRTVMKAFSDYAHEPLNEVAVNHGYRQWGLPGGSNLSDEQLASLRPYLAELGQMAVHAVEWTLYFRRNASESSGYQFDPRLIDTGRGEIDEYARLVSEYIDAHPDQLMYVNARVGPDQSQFSGTPEAAPGDQAAKPTPRERPAPPPAQLYGVSHAGAEEFVAQWMRHLGAESVSVTQVSGDGGIDVTSRAFIAQVKNLAAESAVPVAAIRDLAGVVSVDGRRGAVFTSGIYSTGGVSFADSARIALFRYDAIRGTLIAVNHAAQAVRELGMN